MMICSEIAMFIYYKLELSKYWVAGSFDKSFADIQFVLLFTVLNNLRDRYSNKNQWAVHEQSAPAICPAHFRNILWALCTKTTKPTIHVPSLSVQYRTADLFDLGYIARGLDICRVNAQWSLHWHPLPCPELLGSITVWHSCSSCSLPAHRRWPHCISPLASPLGRS